MEELVPGLIPSATNLNRGLINPQDLVMLTSASNYSLYELADCSKNWNRFGGYIIGGFEGVGICIVFGATNGGNGIQVTVKSALNKSTNTILQKIKFLTRENKLYVYYDMSADGPNAMYIAAYHANIMRSSLRYISQGQINLKEYKEIEWS